MKGEEYKKEPWILGKRLSELKVMYKKAKKEEENAPLREKEKGFAQKSGLNDK